MCAFSLPSPILVANQDSLGRLVGALALSPVVAIDTESNSLQAYRERVCLIQFSTLATDYIIDPIRLADCSSLAPCLHGKRTGKRFWRCCLLPLLRRAPDKCFGHRSRNRVCRFPGLRIPEGQKAQNPQREPTRRDGRVVDGGGPENLPGFRWRRHQYEMGLHQRPLEDARVNEKTKTSRRRARRLSRPDRGHAARARWARLACTGDRRPDSASRLPTASLSATITSAFPRLAAAACGRCSDWRTRPGQLRDGVEVTSRLHRGLVRAFDGAQRAVERRALFAEREVEVTDPGQIGLPIVGQQAIDPRPHRRHLVATAGQLEPFEGAPSRRRSGRSAPS